MRRDAQAYFQVYLICSATNPGPFNCYLRHIEINDNTHDTYVVLWCWFQLERIARWIVGTKPQPIPFLASWRVSCFVFVKTTDV